MKAITTQVLVESTQPGQEFMYRGSRYVRATDDQARKHPAREIKTPRVVLAYMVTYRGSQQVRTPTSFIPDLEVWVRGGTSNV